MRNQINNDKCKYILLRLEPFDYYSKFVCKSIHAEHIPNFYIDDKMQKSLCFRERLEVFHKDNSSEKLELIGQYSVSVESIGTRNQEFLVHIFLSMTVNNHLIVSKLTSSATKELHCLQEKKYESSELNNNLCEKNGYIGNADNGYFIRVTVKSDEYKQSKTICLPYCSTMFISDGCSIVLMRYLAMTDFSGILSFDMITIEGNIVKCDYECSSMDLNTTDIKTYEIVQKLYLNDAVSSIIKNILSNQGNLLSINFINSPYIIKINPHVDHCVHQQELIILPLRSTWKEDFELNSQHFDKKVFEKDRKRKYLLLHSEINELLSDYIQSLLCTKPDDVLKFTIDHFQILTSDQNGKI
ncbi:uncharacterized protein LOC131669556 [Phymastichus coffea]|uniref:uncharacterized protein LOC131669556 n=1 Tax=Phymastichus coffea TaxID=108790 RepID=UPI00273AE9FC|nr:uncharacterized protein LOC131669556 [Phymastichus coffea]